VFGNVLFRLKLKPTLSKKNRHDVAKYYLELVGLSRFERANIHELSGGMKQRVSLAPCARAESARASYGRALCALDALTREQLYGDIQEIWKAGARPLSLSRIMFAKRRAWATASCFFRRIPAAFRKNFRWNCRARATSTVSILPLTPRESQKL
jgi:NitT/TauT family transport system ATP-binding protein